MKKKILISLISLVLISNITVFSFATSITDLKNEKSKAASTKSELEDKKEEVEADKNEALSKINELSEQILESQEQVNALNEKIQQLEKSIIEKEREIKEAEKKQKEQEETLEKRLIAQYKNGTVSYWSIILNPESFLDFFSNLHNMEKIAKIDKELIDTIEKDKENLTKAKEELTTKKSEIKTSKAEAEKENVKLKNAKAKKNSEVEKLNEEEKSLQEQIDEYDSKMSNLEAQIRKAQEANVNKGGATTYNGIMAWPVPGYTKITSSYGMRIHPIYKVPKMHNGIDIGGAPMGAPFVAADDGIVIQASDKKNGYGLCVIIDHGGGVSTLYGHGSAVYVSEGQKVTRGQKVLGIGSSGLSTGKHAHFEVRVNGKAVNPINYVT